MRQRSDEVEDVPEAPGEHARQFIASLEKKGLAGCEFNAGSPA
jgi:hypothetical protein